MAIKYFKVLQAVLSQTRDVICSTYGLNESLAFERAEAYIKKNSEQWRLPAPKINYENAFCRMAYLYMNVAIHANLVELAFSHFPIVEELIRDKIISGDELRICALGGGPGSELLGLVRFIEDMKIANKVAHLDFVLVDRVKEWDESWHALKNGVDRQLKAKYGTDRTRWPVSISRSFLPLDVTSVKEFENFATRFSGTHLFLFCYLVSELKASIPEFEKVVNLLIKRAGSEALLLFIDRDEKKVRETAQKIIEHNQSLELLKFIKERGRLEDELADLGEWYINLPSLPRQKWFAFFTLAQKVVR